MMFAMAVISTGTANTTAVSNRLIHMTNGELITVQ